MATVQMNPRVQPDASTSEGASAYKVVQGFREGTISVVDFQQRMSAAGYGFVANAGAVTTPLTFLVTAANRPDFVLRVLTGRAVIPVSVEVVLESMAGTATEIDIRSAQNDIANGTSSAATVGPINLRTDGGGISSTSVPRQLYTADATAETNPVSLARRTYVRADDAGSDFKGFLWAPGRTHGPAPLLVGPASLEAFIAATTTQATGFVVVQWIETPSNWWT